MLFAKTTPKGTGAEFWGDCNDLESLYSTMSILSLCDNQKDNGAYARNQQLLTIIPYEVRHAFQGARLIDKKIKNGNGFSCYYGFRADWITILYTISALRYNAGFCATNELDQSNLLLFEYWTRQALHQFDDKGANYIELFINQKIDITSEYVYLIHQELIHRYFYMKPSKTRFRSIPQLLISMANGKDLDDFIKEINHDAEVNNCSISMLDYKGVPNIIW